MPFLEVFKPLLAPIMRPTARLIVGLIAIPLFRAMRSRLTPDREWDKELEKDIEQWCRASLVLFLATKNVEDLVAGWVAGKFEVDLTRWWIAAGRLLLAIGVVENMPDQQLFSLIYPGPKWPKWIRGGGLRNNFRRQAGKFLKGLGCLYLSRSSPVYAILSVLIPGTEGWGFYMLAIVQYLFIGLVTSREKAISVLARFDDQVARQRTRLVREIESAGVHFPRETNTTDCPPDL